MRGQRRALCAFAGDETEVPVVVAVPCCGVERQVCLVGGKRRADGGTDVKREILPRREPVCVGDGVRAQ